MSTSAPLDPKTTSPAPSPDAAIPSAPSFEETLRKFWEKNSRTVLLACGTVLAIVLLRGAWDYWQASQEKEIAEAFGAAGTNPERLRTFASAHPEHTLAGVALLTIGDDAYSTGKYTDAATSYEKAAGILKTGPFGGRALLGLGIARVQTGQTADGESRLRQLADDATQSKVIRAEAAYHLGTIALEAGRNDDALKSFDKVSAIDPASGWARRAEMHRSTLNPPAATPSLPKP